MLVDEKPALDEDLLMHFGIKGMKWGVRRNRDSGGSGGSGGSSAPKQKMSTKKKVVIGVSAGIALGAATAAFILAKRSGVKVGSLAARAESKLVPGPVGMLNARGLHVDPSPQQMHMIAGMRAQRALMDRIGAQKLTEKTWRDSVKIAKLTRDMNSTTNSLLDSNSALLRSMRR